MCTSQDFVNWVCGPHLESSFLRYVFLAEHDRMGAFASGTTHQTIYYPEAKALHVALPAIREQRAITALLGGLDSRIEALSDMNTTLEATARAIFKSWFVDFDPVRAKAEGREPEGMDAATATLFPDSFSEANKVLVPSGWAVRPLSEFMDVNPTRSLTRDQPAPYLEMANAPTAGPRPFAWTDRVPISGCRFQNGDTLLAKITPCLENGKTAFVDFLADGQVGWGSTEFIVLAPRAPISPAFGYLLARDPNFRAFAIQSMSGTSGRQRVQVDQLSKYEFPIAGGPVYRAFAEMIEPIFRSIGNNAMLAKTLSELRDTLLPRLNSGKLRITEAEELVEAAL